jgi:vitamin B12 transporter
MDVREGEWEGAGRAAIREPGYLDAGPSLSKGGQSRPSFPARDTPERSTVRPIFTSIFISTVLLSGAWRAHGATVSGVVVDPNARPIPRVLVTATDGQGRELARTFTALDGSFTLTPPDGQPCFLEAQLTGFLPVQTDCGTGAPVHIVLPVAALEEVIVVSATRGDAPVGQLASSTTIFTERDLERRQRPLLSDLLRSSAGTTIAGSGAAGGITSLFLRGGESSYTKVLLDGIPLNEPGGTYDLSNVTTEHLARVELVRGAHSALFGSDAVAGVLQLFTARARPGEPITDVTFEGGSVGSIRGGATFARATHSWDYALHASGLTTDNDVENNDFTNTTLSASAGAELNERTTVRALVRGELGRAGTPGQVAFGRPDLDAFYRRRYGVTGVTLAQQLSPVFHHAASYSYAATHQTSTNLELDQPYTPAFEGRFAPFQFFDFPYDTRSRLRRHHAEYQLDWRVTREAREAGEHLLTAAVEWDGERATLEDRLAATVTRASRDNLGATLQHQVLWPRVFVTAGLRLEQNDSFGFAAVPRASAAVILRNADTALGLTKLKLAAGAGVKEPTILQSFSTSPFFLGNPDLEPERSRTFEAGIEQSIVRGAAEIELTWFANSYRDIISTRTLSFNPFRSQFFNIGLTRARGFELVGKLEQVVPFRIRGGYTLLRSRVLESAAPDDPVFGIGQSLFRRPRHSGFVDIEFDHGPLVLMVIGTFIGQAVDSDFASLRPPLTINDGHKRWDVRGSYDISSRLRLIAAVDNLQDNRYHEPLGYPVLGRTARAGLHVSF